MASPRIPSAALLAAIFSAALCACGQGTFSTGAIADAFVAYGPTGNLANNNYGGGGALALAAGDLPQGAFQSVLQFNLSGAVTAFNAEFGAGQWTVQSVTLQLTSSPHNNAIYNTTAPGQFEISLMQNNSWAEGTGTASAPATDGITYNTLLGTFVNPSTDQALGAFNFPGGSSGANSYTLGPASSLEADIEGGDDLSLRLYAADNNVSYLFSSSRASSGGPELMIVAVPEPGGLALGVAGLAVLSFWHRANRPRG